MGDQLELVLGYILQKEIIHIDFFGVLVFILFFIFLIGGVVN